MDRDWRSQEATKTSLDEIGCLCSSILCFSFRFGVNSRAGTRLFKNRRLIEYLKEATRLARLGTRSVLSAAGKVEI